MTGSAQAGVPGRATPVAAANHDKQALLSDIERTREQLAQTVEALTAKADVKARAEQKAADLAGRMRRQVTRAATAVGEHRGQVAVTAGTVLAGWLAIRKLRR